MLFLYEGPVDTGSYMILGFGVIYGFMAIYVWSLNARNKKLKEDLKMIKDLDK